MIQSVNRYTRENFIRKFEIEEEKKKKKEVSFQTSFERNSSNFFHIFLLDVNFENLTIRLYVLIISSILAKFQEC